MPYNGQIPDAPIAGSMLPRATALTKNDLKSIKDVLYSIDTKVY